MATEKPKIEWRDLFFGKPPSTDQVNKFHEKADKDASPKALHHTLGPGANQAASGDHSHDGGNSTQLLTDVQFTGSRATFSSIELQMMNALISLGATDNTTP
jgi:hypothetical protein